jgi:hypothetical protein
VPLVQLPTEAGRLAPFDLLPAPVAPQAAPAAAPRFNRLAYAAAHVVALPPAGRGDVPRREQIDWDATLRFRRHLWRHGFGVAEAMDTAQREILGWETSAHLLHLVLREAAGQPGRRVLGGAGTDHLAARTPTLAQIVDAYVFQAEFIHARGGRAILFPTELLPRHHPEPRHYVEVYRAVAQQVSQPVFVHWLGAMFAPALAGYFPGESFWEAMADNPNLLGVKVSLLDQAFEERVRRRLAGQGQIVLTGDDFNFPALIEGRPGPAGAAAGSFEFDGGRFPLGDHSHALLGIFDGIAPVASRALASLAAGDAAQYRRLLGPTVPLSRHIFREPTRLYKAGLVFLAYLNGHQAHFGLLDGLERGRDIVHYAEVFRLANAAGALDDPGGAYDRFRPLLERSGF